MIANGTIGTKRDAFNFVSVVMEAEGDRHAKPHAWPGWNVGNFGLELQSPFAGYVLDGRKAIETRAYPLPPALLSSPDGREAGREVRIDVLESSKGRDGVSSVPDAVSLARDDATKPPPPLRRAGWCSFDRCFRYATREQFEADEEKHLVDPSSGYGWTDARPMYGWAVASRGVYDSEDGDGDDCASAERRRRSLFELLPRKKKKGPPKILITGASGMLGRALHRLLLRYPTDYDVVGTGHTRLEVDHHPPYFSHTDDDGGSTSTKPNEPIKLHKLDLLDADATTKLLEEFRPDVVVHCAAERYPDAFETKLEESMRLNVEGTKHLARECRRLATTGESTSERGDGRGNDRRPFGGDGIGGPHLIYISTSYVFDGGVISDERPPYRPRSKVNPINNYGRSKWEGERAVRDALNDPKSIDDDDSRGGRGIVVRVPLLYGEDCADLGESPALEMMKAFLPMAESTQTKKKTIDHWALRFPTSVEDVARVLRLMIDRIVEGTFPTASTSCDTYHVASPHGTTKYDLMKLQARLLGIADDLVEERTAGNSGGPPENSAPRPRCTQLDCRETWEALGWRGDDGDDPPFEFVSLERGMARALSGFPGRFV